MTSITAIKTSCRAATTENIALYGEQEVDGVAVIAGDLVLVKDQTAAYENGIYDVDIGQWQRAKGFRKSKDIAKGTLVYVTDGETGSSTIYAMARDNPVAIGTDPITWARPFLASSALAGATGATLIGYKTPDTGAVQKTLQSALTRFVNVLDEGPETMGQGLVAADGYIQAAINAASARGGGVVILPSGVYRIYNPLTFGGNNVVLMGSGPFVGGTVFLNFMTSGNVISIVNGQYCGLERIYIRSEVKHTSGYGAVIDGGCFGCYFDKVRVDYTFRGAKISGKEECWTNNLTFRYLLGDIGLHYVGTDAQRCYRLTVDNIRADNPYNRVKDFSKGRSWLASTAFPQGATIAAGGNIWQADTGGTTGASSPSFSTIPGTGGDSCFTTDVNDGTVKWRFCGGNTVWIVQDSYAYSLNVKGGAVVRGYNGYKMIDSANTGTSYPQWFWNYDFEIDHPLDHGAVLAAGEGFYATSGYFCSATFGNGIDIQPTHRGEISIVAATRIQANGKHGINVSAGPLVVAIDGNIIGDNGLLAPNTYDGVHINGNAMRFKVRNNTIGDTVSLIGNFQRYGVCIDSGVSDKYIITGNDLTGNMTGGLSDGGIGTNKVVSLNLV
jgi:hypothetical protein